MRLRPSRVKNLIAKVTSTDPGGLAPPTEARSVWTKRRTASP